MTLPDLDRLISNSGSGSVASDWSSLLGVWAELVGAVSVSAGGRCCPFPTGSFCCVAVCWELSAVALMSGADASGDDTDVPSSGWPCSCPPSSGIGMRAVSAACLPGDAGGVPLESGNTADRGERDVGERLRVAGCVDPPRDSTCGVVAGEWKYCGAVLFCWRCAAAGYTYFFINLVEAT